MNRRDFLRTTAIVGAFLAVSPQLLPQSFATSEHKKMSFEEALRKITHGKPVKPSDKIKLIAPSIAENGAVVPIKVQVDEPIEKVKAIHIFAKLNYNPHTMSAYLTPQNGKPYIATRIRLAKTMPVIAVVELTDGTFLYAEKPIKVTIGGCG